MTLSEAKRMCSNNDNYYIAWTYSSQENEKSWRTKKEAEEYRNVVNIPEFATSKAKAAEYYPVFQCLYKRQAGLERNVIVEFIN